MAHFSAWLASGILQEVFRSGMNIRPTTVAIALCSGIPQDENDGGNIPEIANAGGYIRWNLGGPSNADWDNVPLGVELTKNSSGIVWPTATATWGWVSGIALVDSVTYGAGHMLMYGPLSTAKFVTTDDIFQINSGSLSLEVR